MNTLENGTAAQNIKTMIAQFGANTSGALEWLEVMRAQEMYLAHNGGKNIRATAESGARSCVIAMDAYREAIAHAAAFGSAGDWESIKGRLMVHVANLGQDFMESIYPVAEATEESAAIFARFHKWFDGIKAEAAATEQGQAFMQAGFTLWHTGGGCTAWRRDIEGAGKFVMVTDGDLGHKLSAEDVANGFTWVVNVMEDEGEGYSETRETAFTSTALGFAEMMTSQVRAGDWAGLGWHFQ